MFPLPRESISCRSLVYGVRIVAQKMHSTSYTKRSNNCQDKLRTAIAERRSTFDCFIHCDVAVRRRGRRTSHSPSARQHHATQTTTKSAAGQTGCGVWIQLHRIDPSSKCRFIIPRMHALDSQHDRKLMAQVCRTARRPASSQVSHYCLGSDGVGKAQARPRRNTPLYVCELTLDMSRACRGESSFESFVLNSQGKARQNQKGH